MPFQDAVLLELFKTGAALLMLVVGWVFGHQIVAYWDRKKKRHELDLASAAEFHKVYGEFKTVSRLWRIVTYTGTRDKEITIPEAFHLELLKRAAAAEGAVEAIIVKLATERGLTTEEIRSLGLFRQAYQGLREVIRSGAALEWTYKTPEYTIYNDLASRVAVIISSNDAPIPLYDRIVGKSKRQFKPSESALTLRKITAIRPEDWRDEVERFPEVSPVKS